MVHPPVDHPFDGHLHRFASTIAQQSPTYDFVSAGWPRVSGAAAACDFHTASPGVRRWTPTSLPGAAELARQAGVAGGRTTAACYVANEEAAAAFLLAGPVSGHAGIIADVKRTLPTNGPSNPLPWMTYRRAALGLASAAQRAVAWYGFGGDRKHGEAGRSGSTRIDARKGPDTSMMFVTGIVLFALG